MMTTNAANVTTNNDIVSAAKRYVRTLKPEVKLRTLVKRAANEVASYGSIEAYQAATMKCLGATIMTDGGSGENHIITLLMDAGPAPLTYACSAPLAMGFYNRDRNMLPCVVYDDDARNCFSVDTTKFLMLHELGHVYHIYISGEGQFVFDSNPGDGNPNLVNNPEFERYADAFAATFIGREVAKQALLDMKDYFIQRNIGIYRLLDDIDDRIESLDTCQLLDKSKVYFRQLSDMELDRLLTTGQYHLNVERKRA